MGREVLYVLEPFGQVERRFMNQKHFRASGARLLLAGKGGQLRAPAGRYLLYLKARWQVTKPVDSSLLIP